MDPFKFGGTSFDAVAIGFMPQVKAIGDLAGALIGGVDRMLGSPTEVGFGKHQRFPLGRQLWETAKRHTPVVKAAFNWFDEVAWPERDNWRVTRIRSGQWKRKMKREEGEDVYSSHTPLNPRYDEVFERMKRFDDEGTRAAARDYYVEGLQAGKTLDELRRGLRGSLQQRAPIPLNISDTARFLLSQPRDRRVSQLTADRRWRAMIEVVAPSAGR